jgi:chromosome segregation ATPase
VSLASIDSQISSMVDSIAGLRAQVSQKQDEIERLERVIVEIENLQGDYEDSRKCWQDIQLTAKTWKGELADKFDAFRDGELMASFRDVSRNEVQRVLEALERAKGMLVAEIDSCQMQIATKQSSLDRLRADRKKELQS